MTQATSELTGTWDLDPAHSRLGFAARHAMVATVRGGFSVFSGVIHVDAADPTKSSAEVDIETSSITTGNEQRDGHLRTGDFFETETHPKITFRSTSITVDGDDEYTVHGDLEIKGIAKPVAVDLEFQGSATDPFGNVRIGFEGKTTISRKDWGLTYNATLETGGVLVGDKIKIELDVSAVKRVTVPATV